MELKRDPNEVRADGTTMGSYDTGSTTPEAEANYGGLDSTYNAGPFGGTGDEPFFDPESEFDPVTPMMTAGMNYGIDNDNAGVNPNSQQPSGYYNGDNYNTYNNSSSYDPRYSIPGETHRKLSKKEFFNRMALRKTKDRITYSGGGLILCSVISMIVYWFLIDTVIRPMSNLLGLTPDDINALWIGIVIIELFVIGLGIGIILFQSRVCAGIALALSGYTMINSLVQMHRASGWLPLIASIYAVYATVEFHNAWKQYDTTGHYPGVD